MVRLAVIYSTIMTWSRERTRRKFKSRHPLFPILLGTSSILRPKLAMSSTWIMAPSKCPQGQAVSDGCFALGWQKLAFDGWQCQHGFSVSHETRRRSLTLWWPGESSPGARAIRHHKVKPEIWIFCRKILSFYSGNNGWLNFTFIGCRQKYLDSFYWWH